jgi:hypothetical protein
LLPGRIKAIHGWRMGGCAFFVGGAKNGKVQIISDNYNDM